MVDYPHDHILNKKEDSSTEFKKKYVAAAVAKDICAFANGLTVGHLYYGVDCKEPPGEPGTSVGFCPIPEPEFSRIKQSIEDSVNNNLSPIPFVEITFDNNVIKVSVQPTSELCEVFVSKRYETWIRNNHRSVLADNRKKELIRDNKLVYRGLKIFSHFENRMKEGKTFLISVPFLFLPELDEAIKRAFLIYDKHESMSVLYHWGALRMKIIQGYERNPYEDLDRYPDVKESLQNLINDYKAILK